MSARAFPVQRWRRHTITFGTRVVPLYLGLDCVNRIARHIARLRPDILLVVSDPNVADLYGARVMAAFRDVSTAHLLTTVRGEAAKSLANLDLLAAEALSRGTTRRSIVVALGGGSVGNLAGMLAAVLFRGIRLVHMPTTLLAMHDSATSQKQAVNHAGIKNIVGVYHAPTAVFCDVAVLATLPKRLFRAGLVELAKNALVFGNKYERSFRFLVGMGEVRSAERLLDLVASGVQCKAEVLTADPHETAGAIALEYGHTVGHALELSSRGAVNHGEAVEWGMRVAARVSRKLGHMSDAEFEIHEEILDLLGAPDWFVPLVPVDAIMRRVGADNKRGLQAARAGVAHMVLLRARGQPITNGGCPLTPVPLAVVRSTVEEVLNAHDNRAAICRRPSPLHITRTQKARQVSRLALCRSSRATPRFTMVEIEINRRCNRRCGYCPNSVLTGGTPELPEFMSEEVLERVMDGLRSVDFAGRLSYHFYGEPLLHPDLEAICMRFRQGLPNARQVLYTNGDRLTDFMYSRLRACGIAHFVVTRHDGDTIAARPSQTVLLPADLKLTNRGGVLGSVPQPLTVPCMAPSSMLIVDVLGDVLLCYEDAARVCVMGNVLHQSPIDIWSSSRFAALRGELAAGNRTVCSICRACNNTSHLTVEPFDYVP